MGEARLHFEALAAVLRLRSRIDVVDTSHLDLAVARADAVAPDVVVFDIAEATAAASVRQLASRAPVVAIGEPSRIRACALAGASGFVGVDSSPADVGEAVETVATGAIFCTPGVASTLLRVLADASASPDTLAALTAREREVLELVSDGLSNKEIALRLGIELQTIKNHVHNLIAKLDVMNRGEAAAVFRAN